LIQIAEQAATSFQHLPNLVVAKFNAPENEFPDLFKEILETGFLFQRKSSKDVPQVLSEMDSLRKLSGYLNHYYELDHNPNTPLASEEL
jgi:hypothetical protein